MDDESMRVFEGCNMRGGVNNLRYRYDVNSTSTGVLNRLGNQHLLTLQVVRHKSYTR